MNRSTKAHLNTISEKDFKEWKEETFNTYASSSGNGKTISLGIDGFGRCSTSVRESTSTSKKFHASLADGISEYKKLLSE